MEYKKMLGNLFQHFFQAAKENLEKDGYLIPCVFLLTGPKDQLKVETIIELQFESEAEKERVTEQIEKLIGATGAWGYVIVNECWLLAGNDFSSGEVPTDIPPSKHPKRQEAIWVALFTYEYHRGAAAIFQRHGQRIVFTKEIPMHPDMNFGGRFAELLPPMS